VSTSSLLSYQTDDEHHDAHDDTTSSRKGMPRTPALPSNIFYTKESSKSTVYNDYKNNDTLDLELGIDSFQDGYYDDYDKLDDNEEFDNDNDDVDQDDAVHAELDYALDNDNDNDNDSDIAVQHDAIQDDIGDLEDLDDFILPEESYRTTFPPSPIATSLTPPSITEPTSTFTSNPLTETDASVIAVMEMLRNFDPDKPPTSGDAEELQLWLECFAQREAVTRHQQLVEKARDRKAFDSMSLMQRHVVQWFQALRDAIETRQKEYLSNLDKRRASTRYGPYLCSLHPEKMAVIVSQEAITQALVCCGQDKTQGLTLIRMARAIGKAIETEVVSQRRIKERYRKIYTASLEAVDTKNTPSEEENGATKVESNADKLISTGALNDKESNSDTSSSTGVLDDKENFIMDRWSFSASHLKLFWDDLKKRGMGKNKRSVQYAMRRAKQAMSSEETWTDDDLTHVGAALLSILMEHAKVKDNGKEEPAFRVERRWKHDKKFNKSISYVTIHDILHKIFLEDECMSWAANTTRHLPMVAPPSKWIGPKKGGYRWLQVDLMRTHGSSVQREALRQADLSTVCDGLDILGKTAWRINKDILEAGQKCWRDNISIGDIPSQTDHEVPPEPVRPVFESEGIYDKEDANYQNRIAAMNAYRESISKRQRIVQKNMVSNEHRRHVVFLSTTQ
jgi:hypothetical protein